MNQQDRFVSTAMRTLGYGAIDGDPKRVDEVRLVSLALRRQFHALRRIVEKYGYNQVIIIARQVGENGGEHCATYGTDKVHCSVAARIGEFLKFKVMGWIRVEYIANLVARVRYLEQREKEEG